MSARWLLLACGAMTFLAGASAEVRAAADAGTQSVFAQGAGNRAIGMGGAFVAAADDASAVLWNPAGLGLLTRAEVQGVQSMDLGLGMVESYAAVALPSWRWGTAALSLRRFTVDDIEQRDERNVLVADHLQDQEIEATLGYGRAMGAAWNLGGSVKLQHQSLAGFSGSGLGIDLGVSARPAAVLGLSDAWAQGLSWGIGLRNIVKPSIRLDRESVPDPTALRTGLAWRSIGSTGRGLLAEMDLSRAPGASPRVHAGLEYTIHPSAALRFGVNDGTLTAGAGLRWRDLAFEYAFENAPLSATHRAGLTLHFGQTTEASRLAHLHSEDEAIDRRLAQAFQEQQAERVAQLLTRAREARASGDPDEALVQIALAQTLEPNLPEATALEIACLGDKAAGLERSGDFAAAALIWKRALDAAPGDSAAQAGFARARLGSDARARRSVERRVRFAHAMDAFTAQDWNAASDSLRALVREDRSDSEAVAMLARAESAIARRASEQAEQMARARQIAPASPQTSAPAHASPPRPKLSDREAEEFYQRGLQAQSAQRSDEAVRYWELVWAARPDYREVASNLKREYLARGMELFASGRLDDAMVEWQRVLRVDPTDARARGYLARAEAQRARSREILGPQR